MVAGWLVIGVSGVTCGGKTTLADNLKTLIKMSKTMRQDDYFLLEDDPRHTLIPDLGHFNWEVLTSMDMPKMCKDLNNLLQCDSPNDLDINGVDVKSNESDLTRYDDIVGLILENLGLLNLNVLLIEGFSIFNVDEIQQVCDLKYYFTLSREECLRRRNRRSYNPPDVPGYFEKCVWPEHERSLKEVRDTVKNVTYFNETTEDPIRIVLNDILHYCKNLKS